MRPRRVRLGCLARHGLSVVQTTASMRPRRVRLGCAACSSGMHTRRNCFNEAEARAPRMQWDADTWPNESFLLQ